MSGPAQVRSVAAIERFRVSLVEFEKRVQGALETLASELQHESDWLSHACPAYWQQQEKHAEDAVHQAKLDLERCLIFPVAGERPTCREERAVLTATQDRLEYCREKRQLVRHWRGVLQHEQYEYRGRLGHLRRILETELPAARAKLQLIIRRIEGYTIERPPAALEESRVVPIPNKAE